PGENIRNLNITGAPNDGTFAGFYNPSNGENVSVYWDGVDYCFRNASSNPRRFRHNSAAAVLKFFFKDEKDFMLYPNEVLRCKRKGFMMYPVNSLNAFQEDIKVSLPTGKSLGKY